VLRNGLEPWHLLIVAIVVIVLFGSKKLPDTARALGKSMRILKSEAKAMKAENVTPGAMPGVAPGVASEAAPASAPVEPPAAAR
jgi:sec-independent protein translocase protein TatA